MRIYCEWALVACLVLIVGPATAKGADPALEPLETVMTMHVDGQILIDAEGRVENFEVATDIVDPLEAGLLKLVEQWRFNPVLVDGQARRASARMRVVLAAVRVGEDYRISIDNVVFPNDEEFKPGGAPNSNFITGRELDKPLYPVELQMQRVTGTVLLAILVSPDGRAKEVLAAQSMLFDVRGRDRVLRQAIRMMEMSARSAARSWTFNVPPGSRDGSPREMTVYVPVQYIIDEKPAPGQWRTVVRVPKRFVGWLPGSDPAQAVGVADIASGEVIPLAASLTLAVPVIGSPVM